MPSGAGRFDPHRIFAGNGEMVADVFVRSMAPPVGVHDTQVRVLNRLGDLEESGRIDRRTVSVWGERLCRCASCEATGACLAALEKVREFERWAASAEGDVSLQFERQSTTSRIVDSSIDAIVPPRITLAVYVAGNLASVFPCRVPERHWSVGEGIEALERAARRRATKH